MFLFLGVFDTTAQVKHSDIDYFDPAKGFKPAQKDLTEVFLQMATSLKYYGSPVPYLRHVKAENARVEALYLKKYGRNPASYCPPYITDEYIDRVAANWDTLSPKLGLAVLTKDAGGSICDAINGTRGTGTMLVEIFNEHQNRVLSGMAGKREPVSFDVLKEQIVTRLELDKSQVNLQGYETNRRDAIGFALAATGVFQKMFAKLDASLKPEDSLHIKAAIVSVAIDTGRMAQSELEVGIAEAALNSKVAVSK